MAFGVLRLHVVDIIIIIIMDDVLHTITREVYAEIATH